jgi:hypothetical protein|tara:strand:- start:289 stop:498 length:210 start_codon:yes stop_codon:yes gene_type:complete
MSDLEIDTEHLWSLVYMSNKPNNRHVAHILSRIQKLYGAAYHRKIKAQVLEVQRGNVTIKRKYTNLILD